MIDHSNYNHLFFPKTNKGNNPTKFLQTQQQHQTGSSKKSKDSECMIYGLHQIFTDAVVALDRVFKKIRFRMYNCFMWMWKPMKRSLDVYDIYRFGLLTLRSKCKRVQMFSTINSMCVDRKKGQSRLKMWGALCLLFDQK